jgi:hypothetical protein
LRPSAALAVVCALLYGAALRLQESLSLRVKDFDFSVSTTLIFSHVLSSSAAALRSPMELLPQQGIVSWRS